jgi:formylmethanofuran dehydrogenase subunit E
MTCRISFIVLYGLVALCQAEDHLPQPHYHRQPSDPAWLVAVVQFHGHLGPSVVAGARMGMIGLRAVEAKGYFDVDVTCEGPLAKPPQACFLDGIQVATGATLGKRTLRWVQADQLTVRIRNTRTGKAAVLRPTPALMGLLASLKLQPMAGTDHATGQNEEELEAIARKIATMPEPEVASVVTQEANTPTREFFSTRQGSKITLHPTPASFDVPETMLDWFAQFKNNLHLSRDELAKVKDGAGEWDTEYGLVCNATFPFDRCCAHVGEEGWGRDAVSFADLQVRVYVLDKKLDDVGREIAGKAAAKVKDVTKASAKVTTDNADPWKRWDFAYDRWYEDYGATAHVDFRAKQFDNPTLVFVFMYTNYQTQEAKIQAMLKSFVWGEPPGTTATQRQPEKK